MNSIRHSRERSLHVSQRHGRRVQVSDRLVIPDGHRERERSGVDVEDDADAAGEGLRTEGERDARGGAVADDALAVVVGDLWVNSDKTLVGLSPKP